MIDPTALIEPGVELGAGTQVWSHVHVRGPTTIGRECIIGEKTYIAYGVRIGNLVKINAGVYICTGVEVGDGVMIAAHVVFTNERAPRAADPRLRALLPSAPTSRTLATRVGCGVTIGANATIGPGVNLGDWSMVGMGTVVTTDVPSHGLVVGNPGRLVGLVAKDGSKVLTIGPNDELPSLGRFRCPGGGWLVVEPGRVLQVDDP